jgi:DNA-directed RNA polymerase sigma subunit (sigma70/sigma32)
MEYISDHLTEPDDFYEVFPWDQLSSKAQNTLHRAIERSDVWRTSELTGFSFDLLSKISLEDLRDARSIGPARAEELIQELVAFFMAIRTKADLQPGINLSSNVINVSPLHVLAKLTVEENLDSYLRRIGSFALLSNDERDALLEELLPVKNPLKRILLRKRDQSIPLGLLIDANLRLSFALAKRVSVERDIRARTVAGNLGLLAGITTFSDLPGSDFERHVMRNIREFIEELVGSLHLSYDAIVELMLGTKEQIVTSAQIGEVSAKDLPFENCVNFSELLHELDRELLKLPKVDQRAVGMLKHRHQAFVEPLRTLDELGKEWGVTRERVRQIVDPLLEVIIPIDFEIPVLVKAVELFEQCEDEDQFDLVVGQNEIFSGEKISWQQLWGLTRIFSPEVLAERVYEKHLELEAESGEDSPIRTQIKKDRSQFGLYDLQVVSKKYEVSVEKAFKVISEIYPRSIRSGNLVLARTKNLDTMFENSISKQLKVTSPLSVNELLKGLQRTGKARDVSLIGSTVELSNLIQTLAGNPPNYETSSSGLIKEVEFQNLEKWLVEIFSDANLGILHSNDVVNFALRNKTINISSVTVYLLNSPILRAHGRSLYSLVGTDVTEEQLDAYIQVIRGSSEASEVSFSMADASKGILSVKPNLNVITSGIVFPPSGQKRIFEGFEFETSCECGALETIQAVKFAPSGFWTGFTAMIRHGFSQHQMSKGSIFRFEFDFDRSVVRLLVN